MKKISLLIPILVFAGLIFGQDTATLTISILNIELNNSRIFVGLYDNEATFKLKSGAVDSLILIPDKETIEVSMEDIPFGNYAVAIFQDINDNGRLDAREFKIPIEPVGISNYTVNKSSLPPTFKKAQFSISGDTLVSIQLMLNIKKPQ